MNDAMGQRIHATFGRMLEEWLRNYSIKYNEMRLDEHRAGQNVRPVMSEFFGLRKP